MIQTSTDSLRYRLVKDLANIVSVFEGRGGEESNVMDISKSLGMLPSKVSRLLRTLESEGFFKRNNETGKYRIGHKFLRLGLLYLSNHPLRQIILPHLELMTRELSLSTGWAIFEDDQVVVVDRFRFGEKSITGRVGLNMPLHSSSYGKLFLAYLSAQVQERLLQSMTFAEFTTATITTPKRLREELKLVKKKGYAVDRGELIIDVIGIAAPVFNRDGEVIAALSTSARQDKFKGDNFQTIIRHLTGRTRFVSRQFGYDIST
jgi:DNA-binding IclR family transcriptional regulator